MTESAVTTSSRCGFTSASRCWKRRAKTLDVTRMHEAEHEERRRDRRGVRPEEALGQVVDVRRGGRRSSDASGDERDRAELADRPREGEAEAAEDRRPE